MPKSSNLLRQLRKSLALAVLVPVSGLIAGSGVLESSEAMAIEGTELAATVGIWAPLLPDVEAGASTNGESLGTIFGLKGHHRFEGYRTSIEAMVNYGITDEAEMFGFDVLLRDTWSFDIGDLSAGTGYSQMNWQQEGSGHQLDSDFRGAKIVAGWEAPFSNELFWIDLTLGLYDLNGSYVGNGGLTTAEIDTFTTTWGIDVKSDTAMFGMPVRTVFGVNYLSDITSWKNGQIGTEDAVVLTGSLEFRLF